MSILFIHSIPKINLVLVLFILVFFVISFALITDELLLYFKKRTKNILKIDKYLFEKFNMDFKNITILDTDKINGNDYFLNKSIIPDDLHMFNFLQHKRGNIHIQTPFTMSYIYRKEEIHLLLTRQDHIELILKVIEIDDRIKSFLDYTHKHFVSTIKKENNIYKLVFNTHNTFNAWDINGNLININSWFFNKSIIKWTIKPLAVWSNKRYQGIQWILTGAIIDTDTVTSIEFESSVKIEDMNRIQNETIDIVSSYLLKDL